MAKRFTETHEVLYYECDFTGRLTVPMMLSLVIKTSEAQSDALNRSAKYVNDLGLTWVITQYEIEITRLPKSGEKVSVTTEADTYNKFFCYRNFWIHDEAGKECVKIFSTFVLMDMETRKMARVQDEVVAPYECEKVNKIQRGEKILPPETYEALPYRVRYLDIDGNQHVNNAKYLDWMLDVLGYDFLLQHTPKRINIKFDREVEYGNVVESRWAFLTSEEETQTSAHQIYVEDTLCAEANIFWQ